MKIWPFSRKSPVEQKSLSESELLALFTGLTPGAGISAATALTVPAVAAAVRVISEAAATLDIRVIRTEDAADDNDHPVAKLLHGDVNDWTSGYELIRDLVAGALTRDHGSMAWVNRVDGKPRLVVDNGAVSKAPAVPSWLSKDAKAEWRRVVPILVERRILTTADLGSLENYCTAIGQVREMERHLQEHGHVFESFKEQDGELIPTGLKRNPAVGIQSDAMTRARLLAAELGLTPVSRSRPAVRGESAGDDLDFLG